MKDKRFKIAHREAIIGIALVLFNFIWWFGFAYGMGGVDPTEYRYIFGMPEWFFYSCVLGFIVVVILVFIVVNYIFKEVPFEDDEDGGEQR
ncbi:YhdT family protein [Metabacillus niabensis]|uniref:YhdT family protein n=1 Tax=Metabacillus niabensis TaxID=324854 RepID=UPI0039A234C9